MPVPKDKCKFALWVYPETMNQVNLHYRANDCRTKSEFIEKAIRFYVGYLTAENPASFLPNMFLSNMKAIVDMNFHNMRGTLFQLTLELALGHHIIASNFEIDKDSIDRLRGELAKELKKNHKIYRFEEAVDWQK